MRCIDYRGYIASNEMIGSETCVSIGWTEENHDKLHSGRAIPVRVSRSLTQW
jgi:hypothetical protein